MSQTSTDGFLNVRQLLHQVSNVLGGERILFSRPVYLFVEQTPYGSRYLFYESAMVCRFGGRRWAIGYGRNLDDDISTSLSTGLTAFPIEPSLSANQLEQRFKELTDPHLLVVSVNGGTLWFRNDTLEARVRELYSTFTVQQAKFANDDAISPNGIPSLLHEA